jgi:hypothetical protein
MVPWSTPPVVPSVDVVWVFMTLTVPRHPGEDFFRSRRYRCRSGLAAEYIWLLLMERVVSSSRAACERAPQLGAPQEQG